jgi:hypothetical protein
MIFSKTRDKSLRAKRVSLRLMNNVSWTLYEQSVRLKFNSTSKINFSFDVCGKDADNAVPPRLRRGERHNVPLGSVPQAQIMYLLILGILSSKFH